MNNKEIYFSFLVGVITSFFGLLSTIASPAGWNLFFVGLMLIGLSIYAKTIRKSELKEAPLKLNFTKETARD